jgi:regulator of replication initiation timing
MAKYYSRSKQKFIDIANMPDQYVRNAFVKMCKHEPTEDAIFGQQQKERADRSMKLRNDLFEENLELEVQVKYYKKLAEDNFASSTVDLDKIEKLIKQNKELQLENQRLVQQLEHDETVVSKEVYQAIFDKCQKLEEDYKYANARMMNYATMLNNKCPKGDVKMFSEIPNTDDGWEFVDKLKRYLNKESYKIRVRGQYLNDETKQTEGWRGYSFGQPIEKSKCLRVYVDVKKGD